MKRVVLDIEADNLLEGATHLWCASFLDLDTMRVTSWRLGEDPERLMNFIISRDYVVGHNLTGYDFPLLIKIYGQEPWWSLEMQNKMVHPSVEWCYDTYEVSLALKPERFGGHSVEGWAAQNGLPPKVEIDDWQNLPLERYVERGEQDVRIEHGIYKLLKKEEESLLTN